MVIWSEYENIYEIDQWAEFFILSTAKMEFVALSDTVLNHLARQDPDLNKAFRGVFPADKLPTVPKTRVLSDAYIVNTDPEGQPGEHWLAIWTCNRVCEVFDSYGLLLSTYKNPQLQAWFKQWKEVITSDHTLQAMDTHTCGHYALVFLNAKVRQQSFQDFLAQWNAQNLVLNDRRAGEKMRLIKTELCRKELSCKQSSVSRDAFCYFYHLE